MARRPVANSLYWYDLETTGTDRAKDRIMQFAGVRTDQACNVIGRRLETFIQLAPDVVPHPEAVLVTGITPQIANRKGIAEWDAVHAIQREFARPNTCIVGYNNLEFDDEFIRFTFWRNFLDPYRHTWSNGNSRADLLNIVRLTAALRPEGMSWPVTDGMPSFKLTDVASANDINIDQAHDAVGDVLTSIQVAKLIQRKQPRLWEFALSMRKRAEVERLLEPLGTTPVVFVAKTFGNKRYCIAPVLPMAKHPSIPNRYIVVDLTSDVTALINGTADEIRDLMFQPGNERPRIPLHNLSSNRVPTIAPMNTLRPSDAERLGIDLGVIEKAVAQLQRSPGLDDKIHKVYETEREFDPPSCAEEALYDGFVEQPDAGIRDEFRDAVHSSHAWPQLQFKDWRLNDLAARLKAHTRPDELSDSEQRAYRTYVQNRLHDKTAGLPVRQQALVDLLDSGLEEDQRRVLSALDAHFQVLSKRFAV